MSYKNENTGQIISDEDFNSLPQSKQHDYVSTEESPTHEVDDDDDDFGLVALGMGLLSGLDSGGSIGGDSGGSDFGGFGGGDGGGGGASGGF